MMLRNLPLLAFVVTALALPFPAVLHAEEDDVAEDGRLGADSDYDRARELLEHGEIRPLREIIASLSARYPGEVVDISLARRLGHWIYEFRILGPDGHLFEVSVDAQSMNVVPDEDGD